MNIELKVADLFHPQTGVWHHHLLTSLFYHSEIKIVKAIRPQIGWNDSYCWSETRSGIYTAKSGYDMMFRLKIRKD